MNLSDNQSKDIEYTKSTLISEIDNIVSASEKISNRLSAEVLISIIYLKAFYVYIQEYKKIEDTLEAWKFMNDIDKVVSKVFYVKSFMDHLSKPIPSK